MFAPQKTTPTALPSSWLANFTAAAMPIAPAPSTNWCVDDRMSRTASAISASVTVTKSARPDSNVGKVSAYDERVATPSANVFARAVVRGSRACQLSCAAAAPAA